MQAEITFSENTVRTKATGHLKIFQAIKPIQGLRQFSAESDWDENIPRYEKYINLFSWVVIIASAIFLTPVCINIFIR